ncbi:3388_t:CDS:1, partial [Funneliformis geosporum]
DTSENKGSLECFFWKSFQNNGESSNSDEDISIKSLSFRFSGDLRTANSTSFLQLDLEYDRLVLMKLSIQLR